jgi:hypothetical protein
MNRECGITTVDEVSLSPSDTTRQLKSRQKDIPERWRASALSKVEMPSANEVCNLVTPTAFGADPG